MTELIPSQPPRLSMFERGSAEWLSVQEALSRNYGQSLKMHLLADGRWAIFDRDYALRAIVGSVDGLDAALRRLWVEVEPRAAPEPAVRKKPSAVGKIDINLDDLFK